MLTPFYEALHITSEVSVVIISVALMLLGGFLLTRLTKRLHLPNVTAYIVAGILLGPYGINCVPERIVQGMDFIADIALAFIAFSTGEFLNRETLRKSGGKAAVITLWEACLASAAVFAVCYGLLRLELSFSVVLAALAAATAPASTVMTIRQTRAKGDFVETLLQVVALDDVVGLIEYSIAVSVALAAATGSFSVGHILRPLAANALVLGIGGGFGWLLRLLLYKRSTDNRLIVSIAMLFAFCGICALLDVSPLLGCMAMGTVYRNLTDDERLFRQLNYFSPPLLLLFFVRSGVNFDLGALGNTAASVGGVSLLAVGVIYFLVRIVGKYAGAFLGCAVTGKSRRVRQYLGLALIPQAGVAIGLAAMGARTLGGETGAALETIILASSVLYELIGPACAKLALYLSGSYSDKLEDLVPAESTPEGAPPKTEVELLIDRIQAIQRELPQHENPYYEEEQAFTEAAERFAHTGAEAPPPPQERRAHP